MTIALENFALGPGTILDLAALAVFVIVVIAYARRGFLAGVIYFSGNLVSVLGAQWVARKGAAMIFDTLFAGLFAENLAQTLQNSAADLGDFVEDYAGFLPQSIRDSILKRADEVLSSTSANMVETIVDDVIAPLITPIIAVLVFFVSYALVRAVVALLVQLFVNFNRLPVLGGINSFLGGVMGIAAGALDVFLILCAVWAVLVITGNNLPFLNENALSGSVLFGLFEEINLFAG